MIRPAPLPGWALPLLALAALLRLQGLGWDDWRNFHPDELNLVAAAHGLVFPGGMVTAFHAYNGLALALPKALAVLLCGPAPGYGCITWAARLLSALMASGAVWLAFAIARRLGGDKAGLFALLLVGLSAPLLQWAHFGTTESALTLAVLALWLQSLRFLSGEDSLWRSVLVWSVTLGLGLGMKTTSAIFALIPLAALGVGHRLVAWRTLLLAAPAGMALALGLFVLTTPALIFATADYLATMRFEAGVVSGGTDVFWTWQFAGARAGIYEASQLWQMTTGTGFLLALAGLAAALARRKSGVAVVLVFALAYGALICGWHAKFTRYLAPLLPVVLILAALGAAALWQAARGVTGVSLRFLLAAAVLLPSLAGLSLAASYRFADSRINAAAFLAERLLPGDLLLVEPHDVGPASLPGVQTRVLPIPDGPADPLAADLAEGDWLVLLSRRHWAVLPRLPERFATMCGYYAALASGELGYRVVRRLQRFAPLGGLFDPGLAAEETRAVFDRPEVLILQNIDHLTKDQIIARIAAPAPDCRVERLQQLLERQQ